MTSLVWKELRENIKWALLAMAALGIGQMYGLYHTNDMQPDYSSNYMNGVTLCKKAFLLVTTFGCAGTGFLLGLLQVLPELRRDQWAALLHRPVPRGVIFLGKAAAGVLLYALATVPPFLLSVWLVVTPGHFPSPFVPGMVFPGVADIGAGIVYYFAALALALQRGKWIGLRAFPLLAAFHSSCFVNASGLFYVAIEAAALMSLALFVAAWGTMLNQDKFAARPWLFRVSFLAMAYYGVCGFGDVAMSIFDAVGPSVHSRYVRYELSDKGFPLRVTSNDNIAVSVTDLDGRPLAEKEYQPSQIRNHVHYLNGFSAYIGDSHGWKQRSYVPGYRDSRQYLWSLNPYFRPRLEQWFYIVKQQSFVCYDISSKKAAARFDQRGIQPMSAAPRPILPENYWTEFGSDHLVFWDGENLDYVSLPKRGSIGLPLPGKGPVFGISGAFSRDAGGDVSVFGATLLDCMAVYDGQGALVATLPYHQNMDRWGQLDMGLNGAMDRFYLWYKPSAWIDGKTRDTMPSYLEEVNKQGEVLHTWTLPPLPRFPMSRNWGDFIAKRLESPAFFFGGLAYQKIGAMLGSKRLADALAYRVGRDRPQTREIAIYVTVLALMLAAATLYWARRVHFAWPAACAWAGFVFFFNVAGIIAFRLATDWPRMVGCASCQRLRPIEGKLCPHCDEGWPERQIEGTEIFDNPAPMGPVGATA